MNIGTHGYELPLEAYLPGVLDGRPLLLLLLDLVFQKNPCLVGMCQLPLHLGQIGLMGFTRLTQSLVILCPHGLLHSAIATFRSGGLLLIRQDTALQFLLQWTQPKYMERSRAGKKWG